MVLFTRRFELFLRPSSNLENTCVIDLAIGSTALLWELSDVSAGYRIMLILRNNYLNLIITRRNTKMTREHGKRSLYYY